MKHWEIERLFNDDIRDKRKAGSGSFHKRGKGVKHGISGALRTPFYYMSNKEKKKLNGEVQVYQMYETIIPIEEFRLKDEETQRAMLTKWREIYDNGKIQKDLGIANSPFFKLIDQLRIPKKPRGGSRGKGTRTAKVASVKKSTEFQNLEFELEPKELKKETQTISVKPNIITKGLHLEYNGKYDVESLSRLFTKLQLLIDGEPCDYNIALSLTEIPEKKKY